LVLGLVIALYGVGLIAGTETVLPYLVRDGLLAALVGGVIFAANSGALPNLDPARTLRGWPATGRLLLTTGVACSLAAVVFFWLLSDMGWSLWLGMALWALAGVLTVAGIWWPGEAVYGPPAYRWGLDAAGRYVRLALEGEADSSAQGVTGTLPGWGVSLAALLVMTGGWVLRLWRLGQWPPACVELECVQALQLVNGEWPSGPDGAALGLQPLLAAALYRLAGEGTAALRWASALVGCATLPATYWAVRGFSRPAGALLALTLLALSPWHIWASRMGGAWIVAPLLVTVAVGGAARGSLRPEPRAWGVAGIALGLLWLQPLPLAAATLAWGVCLAAVGWWAAQRSGALGPGQTVWLVLGSMLAVGLPALPNVWERVAAWLPRAAPSEHLTQLGGLLHGGGGSGLFLANPLLSSVTAALALAGLATLGRWVSRPQAMAALTGLTVYGVAVLLPAGESQVQPALGLLVWLPFLMVAAGVTLDQLMAAFTNAWGRLVTPMQAVAVALALLVVVAGRQAISLTGQLRAAGGEQNAVETAMGRYLAACLAGEAPDAFCAAQGEQTPTFFVPPDVAAHPATRLLVGEALQNGQVRPLDLASDLLPATTPTGETVFLVALDNLPVLELLSQVYPTIQPQTPAQSGNGPTQFMVFAVPRNEVLARQGLLGQYMPGLEPGVAPAELRQDGPLAFGWSNDPPLASPFNVVWEGSLVTPMAGVYLFRVEGLPALAGDPVLSLQVDGRLVLDTSLGLMEQRAMLPQGYVRLVMRYRTGGPPGDWAITWQPPGSDAIVPVPRAALYSPALPNQGLVGTYYAGERAQGQALTVRKDLVLGDPAPLPMPYSVLWEGKVAAPRAGEYLFAVTSDGPLTLTIDGAPVLDHLPVDNLAEEPGFSQASVYLDVGWHPIELRYAPADEQPDLRLLWQPPGSSPMLLLSNYLLPSTAEIAPGDAPLPPAPALLDARLGSGHFALSTSMELTQPARALPPMDLPALPAEPVWQLGSGCGAGAGQVDRPHGLALDAVAGLLFVADSGNRRVVALDVATQEVTQVYASAAFQEPVDVEVGVDGSLLVLDALAQTIFRVDRETGEATTLALETGFYRPRGLAVDLASGNLAVADTGGARVVLLDPAGVVLAQFGGPQTVMGQGQPVDALVDGGQLWTITAENGRLWRLDVMGSFVAIERSNTVDGPQLAALPGRGFFLSDPTRRTVLHLASTGQPLAQLVAPGQFATPTGVAAGSVATGANGEDLLAVADSAACTVWLWRVRL
jgi:hypothetical protein